MHELVLGFRLNQPDEKAFEIKGCVRCADFENVDFGIWENEFSIRAQLSPQTLHQKANTELAVFLLYDIEVTYYHFVLS